MKKKWRFRLVRNFFGLSNDYIKSVYEEFFVMMYHGNWSYVEAYNLPIHIRRFFMMKLHGQIEAESEAARNPSG